MIVAEIHARAFTSFDHCEVRLPPAGIVLVTGPNGAGKSSLVEAVSVACWGKTLRGTPAWRDGQEGVAFVITDAVLARRTRTAKGGTRLEWEQAGQSPVAYETTTKAQAALERVVGTHDVWRRTCVFSSQDAAHFTLATDGERKRLLESLLGLDRFDVAADVVRAEHRAAEAAVQAARATEAVARERAERQTQRRVEAEALLAAMGPEPDPAALRAAVVAALAHENAAWATMRAESDRLRDAERALADASRQAAQAAAELGRLAAGACASCGRPWEPAEVQAAIESARATEARLGAWRAQTADERRRLAASLEEAQDEHRHFGERRAAAEHAEQAAQHSAAMRAHMRAMLATADDDATQAQAAHAEALQALQGALAAVAEAQAAAQVLSLTGVRAQLLATALGGIEQVANAWLGRIVGWGMRVELKPYAEKAGGGVRDAISLEVHGAGGGFGYRAASGGQRRRIDVALLFALAEVAAAAHATPPGTLWLDEVFDALDTDGIDAVCAVVEELAQDRAVVLVTHNPAMVERLRPDLVTARLRVESGVVSVLGASPEEATQ